MIEKTARVLAGTAAATMIVTGVTQLAAPVLAGTLWAITGEQPFHDSVMLGAIGGTLAMTGVMSAVAVLEEVDRQQ